MSFYSKNSPYYKTEMDNGYLDVITFRDIPLEKDDHQFEITSTYNNRPDLLAYDLYKDSKLWWVFALRNKDIIKDPVFDFVSGKVIYLPKYSTLKEFLGL